MGMIEAYKTCIRKYAVFDGRARRSEYWFFVLCNWLIMVILSVVSGLIFSSNGGGYQGVTILTGLYSLFTLLPGLAVTVRRLHDAGSGGAYIFISLIPAVGWIILLVKLCQDSTVGANQFGENPKNVNPAWQQRSNVQNNNNVQSINVQNNNVRRMTPTEETPVYPLPPQQVRPQLTASCVKGAVAGKSATGEVVYIGRDPSLCQIVFPSGSPGVSRIHCMLHAADNGIELTDLGSTYGTFLTNGTKLVPNQKVMIRSGESFYIGSGSTVITVRL